MSGKGVWTYIVLPITNGPPSCPRNTPVENVHATLRFLTFSVLMLFSVLYLVAALFLLAIVHCLSSSLTALGGITAAAFDGSLDLLAHDVVITGSMNVAASRKSVLFMSSLLSGRCACDKRDHKTICSQKWLYSCFR